MKAAGDKIKILYGVEGYYINDIDDKLAVYGNCSGVFNEEIVVFDIETTGLNSLQDTITEIGAIIMREGREIARFQTFADPGCHIPANITQLTGISDSDVMARRHRRRPYAPFWTLREGGPSPPITPPLISALFMRPAAGMTYRTNQAI